MEVDDGSSVEAFMQILNKQKLALQAASKRKGEQPKDRKSRERLITGHMLSYMRQMRQKSMHSQQQLLMIHQSFVPPPYLPSTEPLQALKKLYIQDLKLEIHHRGSYILLKAVTPPTLMTAAMTVMVDEKEEGVSFQLYQQKSDGFRAAEEILQVCPPGVESIRSPSRFEAKDFLSKKCCPELSRQNSYHD